MSSSSLIYKYPLDLTGINPNNLVMEEPHVLQNATNRALVPNYGAFFTRSIIIKDQNGTELVPYEQYQAAQLYQDATEKTGLEVATVIVITDTNVSSNITITYQAIGGEFSHSVPDMRQMIETLNLDNRPVSWGDMIGVPSNFPPAPHLHDAGDLYGFEYLIEALDSVKRAIQTGNEGAFNLITTRLNELNDRIFETATINDAYQGIRSDVMITPLTLKKGFDYFLNLSYINYLDQHVANENNPHHIYAKDVGLKFLADNTLMSNLEIHNDLEPYVTDLLNKKDQAISDLQNQAVFN